MKIAYISPTGVFGGVRIIAEHLNRLTDRGHECTLIATDPQPITWLPCRFEQRPVHDAGTGYEVVVGTAVSTWPAARQMADALGKKAIGLLQMADWLFAPPRTEASDRIMREFLTPMNGVMAISEWLAVLNDGISGREVHRIRNGIDLGLFYPDPFPHEASFDGLTVVIEGYTNNRCKDLDSMAYSAVRRARFDHNAKIRIIGFGQFDPQFEFDHYWKLPPQHIIRKIYSSADIFLKASRFEGRPGPHIEAMATGAVVCTAIGTGTDDLIHESNCLSVPYGDVDGLTNNLMRLVRDVDLRTRLRSQALDYVRDHYDWPRAIDMVEKALTGSVSQPTRHRVEYAYDLDEYNALQDEIVTWEGGQARWLGETLADMLGPESVIDIGCGPGIYLVPFKPEARVLGIDGAPKAGQALDPSEFLRVDLREDWKPLSVYDLSLCIETGEHLPPDRADYLVNMLTTCSDVCFYSAAQPGQGGTMHLNEQPRQWWLDKFRACGWDLHPLNDTLQRLIADNPECRKVQWLIGNAMLLRRL